MEEASVAGESPDRSKQRESSAEPTSGSAVPVPEARSGEHAERDPRLAVSRDRETPSGPRGGVDTATRVFPVRDVATDAEDAVNAEDAEDEDAGATDGTERTDETAEPAQDGAGSRGGADTATRVFSVPARDRAVDAVDAVETGADEGGDDRADADAESDAADGRTGGDAGLLAAWVRPGGSGSAQDASGASDASDRAEDASTAPEDAPTTAEDRAQAPEPESDAKADADDVTDAATDADEAADADARDDESAVTDASESVTADDDEPDGPQADGEAPAPADSSAPAADDAKNDAKNGGEGEGKASAEPVDQPTAVFKRPKFQVDQPTTMLKLGGAAKAAPAGTPEPPKAPKAPKAPEGPETPRPRAPQGGDPERTSRFVALKPLDDPATRKPSSPADATAFVPQVGPERTTQQPLPPKPPLDLLAELTNTPPPPQTPVRTVVRRVKIWTPLVLLLAIIFAIVQAVRPLPTPTLTLTAEESYTFDGDKADIPWPAGGQGALDVQGIGSFGSSGRQKPVPIASVAKVMTAYLILRDHPLKSGDGEKIKVDQTAEEQATADGESTVEVKANDTITEREALEGVLLASANNVARLLARWDAGSEKAFVSKMNAAAKDLGMTNTTYTDPSGLQKTTVSTAVDQVKLAKAAMKEASFREIARMMEYTDYKGTKHSNWNRLVGYNNVIGIKTGTTTAAGGNLVFAAVKQVGGETRTIVGAVLSQGPGGADNTILSGALDAGDKLIRAAQGALKSATILKEGDVVGYVDDGLGGHTPVVITKDVTAVGWSGLKVKLSFAADDLPRTAKAGTKVGTLTVGDGGTAGAVKVPVALQKDLAEPGFTDKLTRVS
ncbi:D-alanyl-D-alanine carboxypeptidase [Streptomyces sp. NPDC020996]|uniref:D-alanyl-D-alanine carboxypeptidase n=1 Tax=Streptomyces sp. NPDC020996 TaxID=3154791 RepID=UPI0033D8FDD4